MNRFLVICLKSSLQQQYSFGNETIHERIVNRANMLGVHTCTDKGDMIREKGRNI